jgi:GNAT superfamily N-acetyltransferase
MVSIQPIKIDDLKELAELYRQLAGKKTNARKMKRSYQWMESNPDYILLGAKSDGELQGSLMGVVCHDLVGECRPFMVIENVIVSRGCRRQDVGTALMQTMEKIARRRDCFYIMFVSKTRRKEAHRFYESLGYRLDAVQGFKKYL